MRQSQSLQLQGDGAENAEEAGRRDQVSFKTRASKGRKLGLKGQLYCSESPRKEQSGIELGVLGAQPGEL